MKQGVTILLVALAGLALAACGGGGDDSPSDPAASSAGDQAQEQAVDEQAQQQASDGEAGPLPAVADDEQAPAEATLEFEERELVSLVNPADLDTRLGSVTVGWEDDPSFPGLFSPPDDPFSARLDAGSSCGGGCEQKTAAQWAEIAEETEFSQVRDEENFEIEVEEDLADGKLVVATNSVGLEFVSVARWMEGRTEYFYCRFSTDNPENYPLAAFEEPAATRISPTCPRAPLSAASDATVGLFWAIACRNCSSNHS